MPLNCFREEQQGPHTAGSDLLYHAMPGIQLPAAFQRRCYIKPISFYHPDQKQELLQDETNVCIHAAGGINISHVKKYCSHSNIKAKINSQRTGKNEPGKSNRKDRIK
jgi:hypothetical protein